MKRKRTQSSGQTWCNVCKIWIADNRAQRDQHETGSKHKAAQAKLIKDIAVKNEMARASEQKTPTASSAADSTVGKQSAAEQLLESAVSYNSFVHTITQHLPLSTEQAACETFPNVVSSEDRVEKRSLPEDDLDENGFPLPANVVMPKWTLIEDAGSNERNDFKEGIADEETGAKTEVEKKDVPSDCFKSRKFTSTKRRRRARE